MVKRANGSSDIATDHVLKIERVVRIEVERKEAKARLKLMDAMSEEIDEYLMCVAEFKKGWLEHRRRLEDERHALMQEEEATRAVVQAEYVRQANSIIQKSHPAAIAQRTPH